MNYKYVSRSIEDTFSIAENIESEKFPGMVICLNGELGSGKTVFTKGVAKALGIDEAITSPTFTIIKEYYEGEMPLFHMDVYRLEEQEENIGIADYFEKNGIVVIEWADIIKDILPEERLEISFKIIDENIRVLVFNPIGKKYEDICSSVL
jgi:tRNA threonylcarbamoyladenosine biosynthesis protein TsaE